MRLLPRVTMSTRASPSSRSISTRSAPPASIPRSSLSCASVRRTRLFVSTLPALLLLKSLSSGFPSNSCGGYRGYQASFQQHVAMVTSDDGSELIVIGRGLCFGRHAGDAIDEASVEKTYALQEGTSQDSRTIDRLAHLLESIPTVNLVISEDIVQMLRRELNVDINDKILMLSQTISALLWSASARASPARIRCCSRSSSSIARSMRLRAVRCRLSRSIWASR